MRRYRFGEANGAAGWLRRSNVLYFILAWNAFGLCAYQWWKSRKVKANPEWSKLTYAQKYMTFVAEPDDPVTVMSMSGLSVTDKKKTSVEEFLIPKPAKPDEAV